MRLPATIVILLLVTFLGGCMSPAPSSDTDPTENPPGNEQEDTGNETDSENETQKGPVPPTVVTCEATALAGVQVNGAGAMDNSPCRLEEAYGSNLTGFQAAVLEVTWDSLGPAVDTVQIKIESVNCMSHLGTGCTHAETNGQSQPLRLDLDEQTLRDYGDDDMRLYTRPEPVASGETFTVYLSLFVDDVPENYTAIE